MTLLQSILLGIVQGLTEFLPVSSSGHLVIVPFLLGWSLPKETTFLFDILVQVATLAGVFAFFWPDLVAIGRAVLAGLAHRQPFADPMARLGWYIVLATVPASLIGLAIKDLVEQAFNSPTAVAFFLFLTAVLLVVAERAGKRCRPLECLRWKDALWVGLFQAIAIFPGVSRSGATITGGMLRDLQRAPSARFSFLMSIPVMLAAGLVATVDLAKAPNLSNLLPVFIPGFISAAIVGYLSIRWLLGYLLKHSLMIFSVYCVVVGTLTLITAELRTPAQAAPAPELQPLSVAFTPATRPLADALSRCADRQPEIALVVDEMPAAAMQAGEADLFLKMGPPLADLSYSAALGQAEIVIIVHPANPVAALSQAELRALFGGQTLAWSSAGGPQAAVQPWIPLAGDEALQAFAAAVMGDQPYSTEAMLAADPAVMLEGVANNAGAIGYLPHAWLTSQVRAVPLAPSLAAGLRLPVLASAPAEPHGAARNFLYCLQNSAGQAAPTGGTPHP